MPWKTLATSFTFDKRIVYLYDYFYLQGEKSMERLWMDFRSVDVCSQAARGVKCILKSSAFLDVAERPCRNGYVRKQPMPRFPGQRSLDAYLPRRRIQDWFLILVLDVPYPNSIRYIYEVGTRSIRGACYYNSSRIKVKFTAWLPGKKGKVWEVEGILIIRAEDLFADSKKEN